MEKFPMSSKLNDYPPLLEYWFNLGRQTGDAWIIKNIDALGQRSTMDVQQLLPGSVWDNISTRSSLRHVLSPRSRAVRIL
jgi:hypothetical protein